MRQMLENVWQSSEHSYSIMNISNQCVTGKLTQLKYTYIILQKSNLEMNAYIFVIFILFFPWKLMKQKKKKLFLHGSLG